MKDKKESKLSSDYRNENIIISFSKFPFCFRSCKTKDFTNFLQSDDEFHQHLKNLTNKVMPHLVQFTYNQLLSKRVPHTHIIIEPQKILLIKEILRELLVLEKGPGYDFEMFYNNNINDYPIWQLGGPLGLRLICIQQKNVFYVLFIDYHHLIYSSIKFNDKDYSNYNFCPIGICEGGN